MGHRLILKGRCGAAGAIGAAALVLTVAGPAAAWTRSPDGGEAGTTISVGSDDASLCRWSQPADPGEPSSVATEPEIEYFDGSRVDLRLQGGSATVALGSVTVASGGGWGGSVSIPGSVAAGAYDLVARCVVDHPDLDGVRSFDFDPLPFSVAEIPPPTVVTTPTEVLPPTVVVNQVEVGGAQVARAPGTPRASTGQTTAATLPNTGDGTLAVLLAGVGALAMGGLALWWGGRTRPEGRPQPHP